MKLTNLLFSVLLLCPFLLQSQVQIDTFYYTGSSQNVTITPAMVVGPTTIDIRGGQGGDLLPGFGGNGGQVIATRNFTAGDRILVAGGGGGCGGVSGASLNVWPGGLGGGLTGGDGISYSGSTTGGGKGGTQSAGGAVGTSSGNYCSGSATAGALGIGGIGSGDLIGGGGGGGGYYGGGGACFSGGGGGSSYTDPLSTNVIHNQGFQSGDGMVIITYVTCVAENQTLAVCDSMVSPSGDYTWTTSGVYADTISPLISCADSAISVDLTIYNSVINNSHVDACSFYLWSENGSVYYNSGIYSVMYQSVQGCDSTVSIDLSIFTPIDYVQTVEACETYTWPVNGQVFTSSTNLWLTTGGAAGCDTNYNLQLTIHNPTIDTETITACNTYTWPVNGSTYTNSTQVTEVYTSAGGCDSTRILDLTINNVDVSVMDVGDYVLTANASSATYQWLDCDNNYAIMVGDTNQVFNVTAAGSYAVEVTQNGCVDTSACYSNSLGIHDFNASSIDIYPNPFSQELNVNLGEVHKNIEVNITDVSGKLVQSYKFEKTQLLKLDFDGPNGYYFIEVKTDSGLESISKVLKR